jgi:ribosome-binding ATPase
MMNFSESEEEIIKVYGLITAKPVLYLANTDENDHENELVKKVADFASKNKSKYISIIGKLEEEISELPFDERQEYLVGLGFNESGLDRLVTVSYKLLNLITYYTAATDLQAWTIKEGTPANKAAGKIHTDFERGFIRAEVYTYDDLLMADSEHLLRDKGRLRSEGKEYVIKEADIVKYLFNV